MPVSRILEVAVSASETAMPYHQDSQFAAPPALKLSQDDRRVIRAQLGIHCRNREITRLHRDLLLRLLNQRLALRDDQLLYPSHQWLADLEGCCPRSVGEAMRRGNRLGLVSWVRRLVRKGASVRQSSNAYVLHPGTAKLVPRCAGRTCDEANSPRIIDSLKQVPMEERLAAQASLADIARRRVVALATQWAERK
jgi:hypothetical protein